MEDKRRDKVSGKRKYWTANEQAHVFLRFQTNDSFQTWFVHICWRTPFYCRAWLWSEIQPGSPNTENKSENRLACSWINNRGITVPQTGARVVIFRPQHDRINILDNSSNGIWNRVFVLVTHGEAREGHSHSAAAPAGRLSLSGKINNNKKVIGDERHQTLECIALTHADSLWRRIQRRIKCCLRTGQDWSTTLNQTHLTSTSSWDIEMPPSIFDGRVAGHLGAAVSLKTLSIHVCVCPHFRM